MVSIKNSAILILGGFYINNLSDGAIIDPQTKSLKSTITAGQMDFRCIGNPHNITEYGKVLALIRDNEYDLHLIELALNGSEVRSL